MSSSPGERTLLLHLGMGKTGSSALQVGLVRNRSLLSRHGVAYPPHESDALAAAGAVTSGNGMRLARFLVPWLSSPGEETHRHLDEVLSVLQQENGAQTVLYSSEFLYHFEPEALRTLVSRCADVGVGVRAVVYVRDIAGHAYSEFAQRVKRALYAGTFLQFISFPEADGYEPALQATIQRLHDVLGGEAVDLLHYDSLRDRLVPHFMEFVAGITECAGFDPVDQVVNRTLTDSEIELMRRLNISLPNSAAGKSASDALVSLPPLGSLERRITSEEAAVLGDRFQPTVSWLNEIGVLEGNLSVLGNARIGSRVAQEPFSDREQHLLAWVCSLLQEQC